MSLHKRRALISQITFSALVLLAAGVTYQIFIAPSAPLPREAIDQQLATTDLVGDALEERRASLAIEHFIKDRKRPPTSLDALVPHYLAKVPRSDSSGEPLPFVIQGATALVGSAALAAPKADDAATHQTPPAPTFRDAPLTYNFNYDPANRRDPFAPYEVAPAQTDEDSDRPPLERYALSDLKLTAIVAAGDLSSATVEDAKGRGYIVRKGSTIGINRGEVTEILSDRLTVVETVKDSAGRSKTNSIVFKLRTKEQEQLLQRGRRQ
jgi:type IV pilus assembly protein PilP